MLYWQHLREIWGISTKCPLNHKFYNHALPCTCTDSIPSCRSCSSLWRAKCLNRFAASFDMLKETETLFQGSAFFMIHSVKKNPKFKQNYSTAPEILCSGWEMKMGFCINVLFNMFGHDDRSTREKLIDMRQQRDEFVAISWKSCPVQIGMHGSSNGSWQYCRKYDNWKISHIPHYYINHNIGPISQYSADIRRDTVYIYILSI